MRRKNDRIWQNLLETRCPKCGQLLTNSGDSYHCGPMCGFTIKMEKFFEVQQNVKKAEKVTGIKKVLTNGKVEFKPAKIFRGVKPEKINLGF